MIFDLCEYSVSYLIRYSLNEKMIIYKLSAIPILTIHVKSEGLVVPGLLYMTR
jgi:hypothetical protein